MTRRSLTLIALLWAVFPLGTASSARADTLGRIRETGKLRLGHRADARPFSYLDESGKPAGYSLALCEKVADAVKSELGLGQLAVEYVKVDLEDRFDAVEAGNVDLLCGAATVTLERRKKVAFSVPIFPSGISALVRVDAPPRFRELLEGHVPPFRPTWRGSMEAILDKRVLSAEKGTTAAAWLVKRRSQLEVNAELVEVASYQEGIQRVLVRTSDAFFADRAMLLENLSHSSSAGDMVVLDRQFTYEPIALVSTRGDEDFRLLVDRTLSGLYRSGQILDVYERYFGKPDENVKTFFRFATTPE
jgi:polar amino acid transport system substrate-binding protein